MNQTNDEIQQQSWLKRLTQALLREPQDKDQLIHLLRLTHQRSIVDADTLTMLEGVIQFSQMKVRDIMIPRRQMTTMPINATLEELFTIVQKSGHSRFPVIGDSKDEVLGILHAKDLINYKLSQPEKLDLDDILRPAVFIPESKRLSILLKDFRHNRNHMAIVVDEYGRVAGFVTIEDIIEQIVGDIADEFDIDEDPYIKKHSETRFIVKAHTPVEEFNQYFHTKFNSEEADTIGGVVLKAFGHLPKQGERIEIGDYQFKVITANNRRIKLLQLNIAGIAKISGKNHV